MDKNSQKSQYFLSNWMERVQEDPERIFLSDELHAAGIMRVEADVFSGRVYGWLKAQGIGKEDFVLICLPRGIRIPLAVLGVWKAGAAFTIVEDTYAPERIEFIREDCGCKVVIDMTVWADIAQTEALDGYEKTDPHDAAFAVYTSGTTGNPKGALHEYGNIGLHYRSRLYHGNPVSEPDACLGFIAPLNFVAFEGVYIPALIEGTHIHIISYSTAKNPLLFRQCLVENHITDAFLSPSMIRVIGKDLPACIRKVYTGSEPANGIFLEGITLLNLYTMSECLFSVGEFRIDKPYEVCPVGKPNCEDIRVELLDENHQPVKAGETGEICVSVPYFRGYIHLPEQTAATLRDGVFYTGDLGMRLPDGNLVIKGRSNDMIKINGNRVEPAEIEAVAKRLLHTDWCAAKGFSGPDRAYICLYCKEDVEFDEKELQKAMEEFLPHYMIPSHFLKLKEVPLLPNGKLNKKALPEPEVTQNRAEYVAPETDLEKRLVSAFEQVLGVGNIGVTEDFYDLGGDSLRTIQLIGILEEPLLTAAMVNQYHTARDLAKALEQEIRRNGKTPEHRDGNAREHDQPLIPMQLFLMDMQLFMPASTFANLPVFLKMPRQEVDLERLKMALQTLVHHHPVLQSVVRIGEDLEFVQHFDPSLVPEIVVEQVSEEELDHLKEDLIRPYKMTGELLYRFHIFETEKNVYLFMDFHHLFSDGASMQVILKNLSDAYHGRELSRDYAYLYARDARKELASAEYAAAREEMMKLYEGKEWCRNFTIDQEDRSIMTAQISCEFPVYRKELDPFLKKQNLSLNGLAVAAALLTLHEREGADQVMASWAYSGRDNYLYQNTVFPLTKEFPAAVSFDQIHSSEELLETVKQQISMGIRCESFPFVSQTTSISENDPFRVRTLGRMRSIAGIEGISCEALPLVNKGAASGRMNIQILEQDDGEQQLVLTYSVKKYRKETAEKILELYCQNIRNIVEGNDIC